MYVPTIIPHAELVAPEAVLAKYRGKYAPEKVFEGTDDGPEYRLGFYESQTESHAAFVAMIEIMDNQVGEIMDKVKELVLRTILLLFLLRIMDLILKVEPIQNILIVTDLLKVLKEIYMKVEFVFQ
ncbi:arylsulfatase [Algibacter lectus]|uniref:Arylsulfatase n=1 Tax=Algibacter lectus TaxID=221126 RepID=A0A090X5Y8_9FLAO|nr:arylsulfatase [Algibacter lectus]